MLCIGDDTADEIMLYDSQAMEALALFRVKLPLKSEQRSLECTGVEAIRSRSKCKDRWRLQVLTLTREGGKSIDVRQSSSFMESLQTFFRTFPI